MIHCRKGETVTRAGLFSAGGVGVLSFDGWVVPGADDAVVVSFEGVEGDCAGVGGVVRTTTLPIGLSLSGSVDRVAGT